MCNDIINNGQVFEQGEEEWRKSNINFNFKREIKKG